MKYTSLFLLSLVCVLYSSPFLFGMETEKTERMERELKALCVTDSAENRTKALTLIKTLAEDDPSVPRRYRQFIILVKHLQKKNKDSQPQQLPAAGWLSYCTIS